MNTLSLRAKQFLAFVFLGFFALGAQAADIDVSPVVSVITNGVATVVALGTSVLSLIVVVRLFSWVRGALR